MTNQSQSFREVTVWQKAHAFTLAVYTLTKAFPGHEQFALTSQLRRAADTIARQADAEEVARLLQGYINGLERRTA